MSAAPVTITGNITADPEVRFFDSGAAKLSFSVAVNNYWTDAKGERQEKTSYFNVVAWRNLAEEGGNILQKGLRVTVAGRLEQESWDDKETGKKRSAVHVLADEIGISVRNIESFERRIRNKDGEGNQTSASPKARPATAPRTAGKPVARVGANTASDESFQGEEPF